MPFVIIAKTVSAAGEEQAQPNEVAGSTLRIGRATDNDLRLEDPLVPLHHAEIQEVGGKYFLRGLGAAALSQSTGEQKTAQAVELTGRGSIKIGPYTLRFSRPDPQSPLVIEYERVRVAGPTVGTTAGTEPSAKPVAPLAGKSAPDKTAVPPPPSMPAAPVAPGAGPEESPENLPTDADDHPARTGRRPRSERINFAAAYSLQTRYINKTTLALASAILVLAYVVFAIALDKWTVLMPGAVSVKHASFVNECVRCHTAPATSFGPQVPDSTCTACHKSPMHFGEHSLAPPLNCTSCHVVHKGGMILANVTGGDCVRCHADLKAKDPTFDIHKNIMDFGSSHPEFAVTVRDEQTGAALRVRLDDVDRLKDGAMIRLNHKLHLDPGLPVLEAGPLQCVSCHKAPEHRVLLMPPVKYEGACAQCHALDFDSKFADKTVPHGMRPHELDLYLRVLYTSLWPLSEEAKAAGTAVTQKERDWINEQVDKAEEKLFGKKGTRKRGKCQLCHLNDPSPPIGGMDDRFPFLAKTSIPTHWFVNSRFEHAAHTILKCVDCHESAPTSEATTDVLLPKAATCRKCHGASGTANAACLECHLFHEVPKPKQARNSPITKSPGS